MATALQEPFHLIPPPFTRIHTLVSQRWKVHLSGELFLKHGKTALTSSGGAHWDFKQKGEKERWTKVHCDGLPYGSDTAALPWLFHWNLNEIGTRVDASRLQPLLIWGCGGGAQPVAVVFVVRDSLSEKLPPSTYTMMIIHNRGISLYTGCDLLGFVHSDV